MKFTIRPCHGSCSLPLCASLAAATLLGASPAFAQKTPRRVPIHTLPVFFRAPQMRSVAVAVPHPPSRSHAPQMRRAAAVTAHTQSKSPRASPPVIVVGHPLVLAHPTVVVANQGDGIVRPHLHEAMAALVAASRTMAQSGGDSAALGQLRSAYSELNESSAADVYHSNRYDAILCTRRAIKLLKEQQPTGEVASLTNEAIGHVQYCLQAPRE